MQSIPFSQLTDEQRARVEYLFADPSFGTDASAYVYELNGKGEITGRSSIAQDGCVSKKRSRKNSPITITMIEEVNPTDETIRHASMSMDALAASVAQRIYQSQTQSIEMENS